MNHFGIAFGTIVVSVIAGVRVRPRHIRTRRLAWRHRLRVRLSHRPARAHGCRKPRREHRARGAARAGNYRQREELIEEPREQHQVEAADTGIVLDDSNGNACRNFTGTRE